MRYALRFTGEQHAQLQAHLFPGDGLEAAALVLCGRRNGDDRHVSCARRIELIPYDGCKRSSNSVDWPTRFADPLITEAMKRGIAIVKIHSHPGGLEDFSGRDDESDESFFRSVCSLLEDGKPHASAVMLPGADGRIFARAVLPSGRKCPVELISVAGDDMKFWFADAGAFRVPHILETCCHNLDDNDAFAAAGGTRWAYST